MARSYLSHREEFTCFQRWVPCLWGELDSQPAEVSKIMSVMPSHAFISAGDTVDGVGEDPALGPHLTPPGQKGTAQAGVSCSCGYCCGGGVRGGWRREGAGDRVRTQTSGQSEPGGSGTWVFGAGRGGGRCHTGWLVESLEDIAKDLSLRFGLCTLGFGPASPPSWRGMAIPPRDDDSVLESNPCFAGNGGRQAPSEQPRSRSGWYGSRCPVERKRYKDQRDSLGVGTHGFFSKTPRDFVQYLYPTRVHSARFRKA